MSVKIGIIGGSGFYKMGIIKDAEEVSIETPFGKPSDKVTIGKIGGVDVAFIPRHGKGHAYPPHKVNYRANVFALKECGVEYLVSTAAVGLSLRGAAASRARGLRSERGELRSVSPRARRHAGHVAAHAPRLGGRGGR